MQKQKTMKYQTSDYLDFDTATALVRKLYREEKYALSLLILNRNQYDVCNNIAF